MSEPARWRYRIEGLAAVAADQIVNQLDFLGEEGWELVAVLPPEIFASEEGKLLHCVFKRPASP